MKSLFAAIILLLTLAGCRGFVIDEHVCNNYYLTAIDLREEVSLVYRDPANSGGYGDVIGSVVYAIGFNNKYIIAKQHPRVFINAPTNYFIVPIKERITRESCKDILGPLTAIQFNKKRKELGLVNVPFSIVYKDLE